MTKRKYGNGIIDKRGKNRDRLRYLIENRAYAETFRGTEAKAKQKLRQVCEPCGRIPW
jgi:hypothetical protein